MSQDQNENVESFNHMNIPGNNQDAPNGEGEIKKINIVVNDPNQKRNEKKEKKKEKKKKKKKSSQERIDNIRRSAFIRLLMFLKIFFKEMFGLNLDSFNCQNDFGDGCEEFKMKMKWEIYQIFCLSKRKK